MKYGHHQQEQLELDTISRSCNPTLSNINRTMEQKSNHHQSRQNKKECTLEDDITRLEWELKDIRMKSKERQRVRILEQRKAKRNYQLKYQHYHKIASQIWRACSCSGAAVSIGASANQPNYTLPNSNSSKQNGFLRHNFYVYSNFLQQEISPHHQYTTTDISTSSSQSAILSLTTEILRSLHGVAMSQHQLDLLDNEYQTLQRWSSRTSSREIDRKILMESRLLSRIENIWAEISFIQRNASPVIDEQRKEIHKLSRYLWKNSLFNGELDIPITTTNIISSNTMGCVPSPSLSSFEEHSFDSGSDTASTSRLQNSATSPVISHQIPAFVTPSKRHRFYFNHI